ncbi:hypothetical protein [Algibacter pectinivorans]|uniref:MetA-pathway of phenol degradation n=1 Tax=Algibacter pectinivorans TaxID=870482 RepID=A0A1I1MZL1_9FLAO|nr:hypothetical protein [Algibacter pectinivorans]SFC88678.1 hypothetical protein SAMN04487987_101522 [Algibacter pectinivorans]
MKFRLLITCITVLTLVVQNTQAQINPDGFFNKKGEANISLSYTYESFEKFYLGLDEVDGVPAHSEIDQNIYNIYANYGITDNITAIVNLPYIKATGNGAADPVNGSTEQSDLQDISVLVKWAPFVSSHKHGTTTGVIAIGGSYAFDYEPNGILSIGNGASSFDTKLGLQYNNNSGFFGNAFVGYSIRGEADNNLGLGTGAKFDVPNSVNAQIKLGYAGKSFYADAWFDAQKTNGGLDINSPDFAGNFPETKVNYSRIGLNLYAPVTKNIGVSLGSGTVVSGRNTGKGTYYTGGLTIGLGK